MTTTTTEHLHTTECRCAADIRKGVQARGYGLSYRQLDHWTSREWVRAYVTHPGYGVYRCWPVSEIDVIVAALELIKCGLSTAKALSVAREHVTVDITLEGVTLS